SGRTEIRLTREGGEIRLPIPSSVTADGLGEGRKVVLGIRPEAITDRNGADRTSKAIEIVEAQVDVVEPAGSDTFVVTRLAGKEVTARMPADADVRAGARVPFAFNLDKALLFDPATGLRL
ncbi:MAG: TOBE domain-containing protein, partial [Methylobacteriaceae bacterium]|nr:TOBE domain-containing protein [Methylobacteriaceae bacterium]